jgi:hypothetical protein
MYPVHARTFSTLGGEFTSSCPRRLSAERRIDIYVAGGAGSTYENLRLFFAAMGKFTIINEGKVLGSQIKETAEDRQKGKTLFSHVELPPGIAREEVEIVRSGWPQSARHRQFTDERLDKIKTVILKEGMSPALGPDQSLAQANCSSSLRRSYADLETKDPPAGGKSKRRPQVAAAD